MSRDLEGSYRRLLRAYPQQWRQQHGDAMVATLLDVGEAAGRTRPSLTDRVDLLAHGVAARAGARFGWLPAPVLHKIGVVALASGGLVSLVLLVVAELVPVWYPREVGAGVDLPPEFGPFVTVGALVYLPFVLAVTAAVLGRARLARMCLWMTLPALVAAVLLTEYTDLQRPPVYLLAGLGGLAVLAALGAPYAAEHRRSLIGVTSIVGVFVGAALAYSAGLLDFFFHHDNSTGDWRWPLAAYRSEDGVLASVRLAVPVAVGIGGLWAAAISARRPGWVVATFVAGAVWLALPLGYALRTETYSPYDELVVAVFVLAVVAVFAVADLYRAAAKRLVGRPSDERGIGA